MHADAQTITRRLLTGPQGPGYTRTVTVVLEAGDHAWNPASTRHDLEGPGTWVFTQHADGEVTAERVA